MIERRPEISRRFAATRRFAPPHFAGAEIKRARRPRSFRWFINHLASWALPCATFSRTKASLGHEPSPDRSNLKYRSHCRIAIALLAGSLISCQLQRKEIERNLRVEARHSTTDRATRERPVHRKRGRKKGLLREKSRARSRDHERDFARDAVKERRARVTTRGVCAREHG